MLAALPAALAAQQAPAYAAGQLRQAAYRETVHAVVVTRSGRSTARDTLDRLGLLQVRATALVDGLRLEVWFDSLTLRRASAAAVLLPDTDGLIGGRYAGVLSDRGEYTARRTPFLPAPIQEVEDLSGVAADLLPPLPPAALRPGQRWRDSVGGIIFTRLDDSSAGGLPLQRYRLERRTTATDNRVAPDSTPYAVSRVETEDGRFVWQPARGVVRWERQVDSQVQIPPGGFLRDGVRSRIRQQVRLERTGD